MAFFFLSHRDSEAHLCPNYDVNQDGIVDILDLQFVIFFVHVGYLGVRGAPDNLI